MKYKDLQIGETFDNLIVLCPSLYNDPNNNARMYWVKCKCGKEFTVSIYSLIKGVTKSCGCLFFNGRSLLPEYTIWCTMIQRCVNPNNISYARYGGRGIKVCDRWRYSFDNFYADIGSRPSKKHSLDRVDNTGNYEPNNCKWVTQFDQDYNKRTTLFVNYNNDRITLFEYAKIKGLKYHTAYSHYAKGWIT